MAVPVDQPRKNSLALGVDDLRAMGNRNFTALADFLKSAVRITITASAAARPVPSISVARWITNGRVCASRSAAELKMMAQTIVE